MGCFKLVLNDFGLALVSERDTGTTFDGSEYPKIIGDVTAAQWAQIRGQIILAHSIPSPHLAHWSLCPRAR